MGNDLFTIKDLCFSYGKENVLNSIDLTFHKGKITTLIGANGCGKSTLFNLMTKNLKFNNGSIFLENKKISDILLKEFAKKVAIVHQYNRVPVDLTVEKLVSYGRTPYMTFGISSDAKEDQKQINRAMEITQIRKLKDKSMSELSGGEKQRVWIAMALAQNTNTLFLDEPTTYLDIRYQLQILKLIQTLNREYGMTVIMVLHDINQALYYSDEIIAMKEGTIISKGDPQRIITEDLIYSVYGVNLNISKVNKKLFVLPV